MSMGKSSLLSMALAILVSAAGLSAVRAEEESSSVPAASSNSELGEITVTARKRSESILNVPVDEQVIPGLKLEQLQITELTDLPQITPGLQFGHSLLSIGTLVSIRGIGTASQDPGVDQSVALNIDGLSLGNGLAMNSGLFDVGAVEVLKGPQALFFGKESPGGVISIRTADPTDQFEVITRAAYEIESVQPRAEFIISGPVADTLKLRLATMYDQQQGYFKNDAIADTFTGALPPQYERAPWGREFMVRGTALWDPVEQFSARLKVNMVYDHYANEDNLQFASCPGGTAPLPGLPNFIGGGENCRLDRVTREVDLNPANFPGILNNGVPYLMTDQRFGTLELNYHPIPSQTLSSTTAYYHLTSSSMVNPDDATFDGPFIGVNNRYYRHEFTEEVRASSDFKGPLNYTLGALYEDGHFQDTVAVLGNVAYGLGAPGVTAPLTDGATPVDIKTYSVFGQGRWDIIENLELAAGVRWTDEKRTESPYSLLTGAPIPVLQPEVHADNTSPEVTLTYKATSDLTVYAAYKQGFKSGSFSTATPPTPGENNAFGEETVKGAEVGLKSRWLDRQVNFNVTPYFYKYEGLQVGVISPPSGGLPVINTLNAATAHTYGVDMDGSFHPNAIEGLQLNANAEFNHGRYLNFKNAPCWGGQTIALGCNQAFNPAANGGTGAYTAQNLTGTPLIRAPNLTGTIGADYTMPVMDGYKLMFTTSNSYTTRYVTDLAIGRPGNDNYQGGFAKYDVGVTLKAPNNRWDFALIANNIGDKITSGNCASSAYKEGVILPNPSGTNTPSPNGYDAFTCFADPGREVWLRVTYRPFGAHS
jgi:iron complex outermembrane receptor protein